MSMMRSVGTMFLGGSIFFVIYAVFRGQLELFDRLLDLSGLVILFFCWMMQLIVNNLAVYLRAHKKEPLMMISFISAVYVALTTGACAIFLKSDFIFLGFLTSYIFGLPIVYRIYRKQKEDHQR
jgi:hypothetical protein